MFTRVNIPLFSFERSGVWIVDGDEAVDGISYVLNGEEVGPLERMSSQNTKPDFHLINPGWMCWRIVKPHVRMPEKPAVIFLFVRVQVAQNHVDLPVRVVGHKAVHKVQEFQSSSARVVTGFDRTHSRGGFPGVIIGRPKRGREVVL